MTRALLGGVEAGGTKMVCAVAASPGEILARQRFATTSPEETLERVCGFFEHARQEHGELGVIGYGTFGPAEVGPARTGYGKILPTPKVGWEGTDVVARLREAFPGVGVAFDTDVNAAAIGEGYAGSRGAAVGLKNYVYVTVGTGIGGGVVVGGEPLHGNPHAEVGHMLVPRQEVGGRVDDFGGACCFHRGAAACLEGLASGTAMHQRWGASAETLAPDHPAWDLEARYLAVMVQNLVACFAPERIILGGGVMEQTGLIDRVRRYFRQNAGGYWRSVDDLLVTPGLGKHAGITGSLVMAARVLGS